MNHNDFIEKYDISHSRGVFTHVANKAKAFSLLSSYAKPGGYVIYDDTLVIHDDASLTGKIRNGGASIFEDFKAPISLIETPSILSRHNTFLLV